MTYSKFTPDALGRIVEHRLVVGKLIFLPHRTTTKPKRGTHPAKCQVLTFSPVIRPASRKV